MNSLKILVVTAVAAFSVSVTEQAEALSLFFERPSFENQLGTVVTDDYSNPGYFNGDQFNGTNSDIYSNPSMSSVVGQTRYTTTGFTNQNTINNQPTNPYYCAGCNGSFLLEFTSTSVGSTNGVFGSGFDIVANNGSYVAFATFGDDSTANFVLPTGGFFGITSDTNIKSIHFGLTNGIARTDGSFAMDNLTIGNAGAAVPLELSPALGSLALMAWGAMAYLKSKLA